MYLQPIINEDDTMETVLGPEKQVQFVEINPKVSVVNFEAKFHYSREGLISEEEKVESHASCDIIEMKSLGGHSDEPELKSPS